MNTEPSAAAVILLREDGAALLQHRDDIPGLPHAAMWTPPGGHCEPGESPEACARREFQEETGYRCDQLNHLVRFWDDHVPGAALWLSVFWAIYDGRQELACHEGQALEFLARADAARYPIPGYLVDLWDAARAAAEARVARG